MISSQTEKYFRWLAKIKKKNNNKKNKQTLAKERKTKAPGSGKHPKSVRKLKWKDLMNLSKIWNDYRVKLSKSSRNQKFINKMCHICTLIYFISKVYKHIQSKIILPCVYIHFGPFSSSLIKSKIYIFTFSFTLALWVKSWEKADW